MIMFTFYFEGCSCFNFLTVGSSLVFIVESLPLLEIEGAYFIIDVMIGSSVLIGRHVVSFARASAISFPLISQWEGTQTRVVFNWILFMWCK